MKPSPSHGVTVARILPIVSGFDAPKAGVSINGDCTPLYSAQDLSCRVVVKKYTLIPLLPCVFDCALLCVTEEKCMRIDLSQYTQG